MCSSDLTTFLTTLAYLPFLSSVILFFLPSFFGFFLYLDLLPPFLGVLPSLVFSPLSLVLFLLLSLDSFPLFSPPFLTSFLSSLASFLHSFLPFFLPSFLSPFLSGIEFLLCERHLITTLYIDPSNYSKICYFVYRMR